MIYDLRLLLFIPLSHTYSVIRHYDNYYSYYNLKLINNFLLNRKPFLLLLLSLPVVPTIIRTTKKKFGRWPEDIASYGVWPRRNIRRKDVENKGQCLVQYPR